MQRILAVVIAGYRCAQSSAVERSFRRLENRWWESCRLDDEIYYLQGERITITKHGVPVAVLQPAEPSRKTEPRKVIAELREFRKKHALEGLSIRDMIEEGRR